MQQSRTWTILGSAAGLIALIPLSILISRSAHPVTSGDLALVAITVLLGGVAIKLICDARIDRTDERVTGYVLGVRETVDRLAASLPKNPRR